MATNSEVTKRYPRKLELYEGIAAPGPSFRRFRPSNDATIRQVNVRLMGPADKDLILSFARALPADHLLFLHSDITDPASVDEWIANIKKGDNVTVLAEPEGKLEG